MPCAESALTWLVCVSAASLPAQVLVRGRLYTVRGKGKSAFLMLRQRTATVQVWMAGCRAVMALLIGCRGGHKQMA